MARPLLLTYNLDSQTLDGLRALCQAQGIALRAVAPWECGQPIGALAGIPVKGAPSPADPGFREPMLVMCHMLSPQLDAFLEGMRRAGLPRIALKAILTPSNVTWSSRQLRDALAQEHAAMQRKHR